MPEVRFQTIALFVCVCVCVCLYSVLHYEGLVLDESMEMDSLNNSINEVAGLF